LDIDPELAEARAVLAAIKSFFEWDLSGGETAPFQSNGKGKATRSKA
jgi:hypothetical protein